jgi:hypothetical protein
MISLALYKILIRQAKWLLYIPPELTFKILHPAHGVHVCVLYGSENKQRLFLCTVLTDWFLQPTRCVFTARYGLNIYKINSRMATQHIFVFCTIFNKLPVFPKLSLTD